MPNISTDMTEETEEVKELRSRLIAEMTKSMSEDTHMFHKFLKARDYNVDKAEIMLRNHLAWRKKFDVDNILENYTPKEVLVKYYFSCHPIGLDKEGCPIFYLSFGNLDAKGIRNCVKFSPDIVKYSILQAEVSKTVEKEQMKKLGKPIPGCLCIVDFKNFSFSKATDKKLIQHVIYLSKAYQDNYPEHLKTAIVINVSSYFSVFYNIIKVFFADSILRKARFYSKNDYKRDLLEMVDADVLPAFLGGNRTDPDGNPLCLSFVNHCGPVLPKYFVNKNSRNLAKMEGVKKLLVRRVSVSEIELLVSETSSVIEWEFETRSRDIGFGLFYKDEQKEEMVELVPLMRMDTDDFPEAGIHQCQKTGTYVIVFDNSYSWIRSKEIYYKIVIKSQKDYEESQEDKLN